MNFLTTASSILGVFLIGLIGYASVKRGLLSSGGLTELTRLLVDFIVPATLFHAMFMQYSPDKNRFLLDVGVVQVSLIVTGVLVGLILHRLLRVTTHRGTVAVLCSMQNNVFLPLPVAMALLPPEQRGQGQFFIGCFVLFFTPTLWSLGVWLMCGRRGSGEDPLFKRLSGVFTPPFVAAVTALVLKYVFVALHLEMPTVILSATRIAGDAATPMAMIVLGGLLAEAHWSRDFELRAIALIVFVKLLLLPALALFALRRWPGIDPVFAFIMLLEAAAPPATNISLVAKRFGGNTSLVALTLFVTYIVSITTMALWLSQAPALAGG